MATRTVPTLKHRAEFMIPLLSLGLFICSMFLGLSAARGGHYATVRGLRAVGVNATALTPAMLDAAHAGGLGAVRFYLEAGVNPDARDRRRRTALHLAASHRQLTSLGLLLDHGANVNAQDISGQTPLYEAVINDFPEGAALLLARGADPDILTRGGETAFSVAQSAHSTALLNVLHRYTRAEMAIDMSRFPRIDLRQWQVMCWENKNWTLYPPRKMSLADGRDAIHVENTTQGNWLATLAYTHRPFETDFDAVLEVHGGCFVTFIAAHGADRTIFCDCPRDSRWHVFNVHRQGKRLSFSVDGRRAPVHVNNVLDSAFTGYVGVQIEKGRSADLRRFEAHALAPPDRAAAGASPRP